MNGLLYTRQTFGNSLQDLAEKLKVSNQMVSMWERGKKPISPKRLLELSSLFGIPQEYFQKELSEQEKYEVQIARLNQHVSDTAIEIEDEVYDYSTKKFITIPHVHYDSGELEHLASLETERRIAQLKHSVVVSAHNVEKYGYDSKSPDSEFYTYNSYVEDNIRLIRRMVNIIDRTDFTPHFLKNVLSAIELLNSDDINIDDETETTKQVYAVLHKCYHEEKEKSKIWADELRQLKSELTDDELF